MESLQKVQLNFGWSVQILVSWGGGANCEGNHAGVASWDKFTRVKGTFTR